MKIHLRFNKNTEVHSEASLFIDGENSGTLVASPAQMVWLAHVLETGCYYLNRPTGRKGLEFKSSGQNPQPTPQEKNEAVRKGENENAND